MWLRFCRASHAQVKAISLRSMFNTFESLEVLNRELQTIRSWFPKKLKVRPDMAAEDADMVRLSAEATLTAASAPMQHAGGKLSAGA